ncbi:MAG: D-alanyl-D-alanine carboxypeptidase [Betaproteobacteria bacterium]|nr:D-alanyl-D-alanine carboxypeptidase [Betaproteobacteria bacterium]MBU6511805.1 D-alanyl-D-alanine carboxypeptidase [Betaproteobacteria bacterium]MDE1956683.1 D-alanyl-D-alanine carboxypeptidase [Betaproteobacteria bacterium]MDE2152113.1 D-alanyl-D-alanine carboxypeptidase [Betaproteobacteria bacterium]MDE2479812.1 D-alanyl-D-alanine carboxypeptidase [Betaproteobacteria bacterium]
MVRQVVRPDQRGARIRRYAAGFSALSESPMFPPVSRPSRLAAGALVLCFAAGTLPAAWAAAPADASAPAAAAASAGPGNLPNGPTAALLQTVTPPNLDARSWLVLDLTSNQVLAQHDAHQVEAPASLTKLMTAYLTFKAIKDGTVKRDQMVHESVKAWHTGGSRMFVDPRVPVSVDDLLMGMIVQSGNDAAMTLAQTVAGSEATFVSMMNNQAQQWGLHDTHFMDPTGLPDPGHHSSAHDLAVIATHIIRDFPADFARYFKVKEFTYNHITQPNRVSLLFTDPSVDGMKTGYTENAGYCMITSALRKTPTGPRRVLTVVMGTPTEHARVAESAVLLNWAYQNFDDVHLLQAGKALVQAPVWKAAVSSVPLGSLQDVVVTVPRGDAARIQTSMQRNDPLVAPLDAGQRVGTLNVALAGKPMGSYPLQVLAPVRQAGFFKRMWDALRLAIK